jgi:alpha-L-fucosidase
MNTPYGRDVVGMLADACHKRGVPLCLYYSIADWHQKNYPNQGRHHELPPQPGDEPDLMKYLEFLKAQVRELCTNYGEIHGFWWDMNVDKHVDRSINDMIRKLQPKAVINNRGFDEGDFGTPERDYEKDEAIAFDRPTEACQSVGTESWGYRKDEDYYTDRHLIRSIDRYLARGANYLLNVGPMPDGTIGPVEAGFLKRISQWYGAVKDSLVDGVEPAPQLTKNSNVLITKRGDRTIYVHLFKEPTSEAVKLKPIATMPKRATLLNDGRPVECAVELVPSEHVPHKPVLRLRKLPVNELANTVLVVKLEFDSPV